MSTRSPIGGIGSRRSDPRSCRLAGPGGAANCDGFARLAVAVRCVASCEPYLWAHRFDAFEGGRPRAGHLEVLGYCIAAARARA